MTGVHRSRPRPPPSSIPRDDAAIVVVLVIMLAVGVAGLVPILLKEEPFAGEHSWAMIAVLFAIAALGGELRAWLRARRVRRRGSRSGSISSPTSTSPE